MEKSTILSAPFPHSSLLLDTKVLPPRIYFRVNTTDIENKYDIYPIICTDGSSMIEGVNFTVSYSPVSGIYPLCIIIAIASAEGLNIFVLDISNAFQNTVIKKPKKWSILAYRIYTWKDS